MAPGKLALATVSVGLALMRSPAEARDTALAGPAPTLFFTLTPCRAVDTRLSDGPLGGPALVAGADRAFPLSGVCGVVPEATAVSVNLTVTGATGVGHLRLHAGGSEVPLVSAINYSAGLNRANNAVVPLSPTGELAAFVGAASGTVHFILDVNGYFAPAATPPVLTGLGPAASFVNVGQTMVPTYPTPLTVTLGGPAAWDTTVSVTSNDPAAVSVVGGGVSIPAGQTSGQVLVTSSLAGTATLTATLGSTSLTASVRALDGTEIPVLASLLPETATLAPNGTLALTVGLDLPAPAGGTSVTLALAPASAGTVPATVTVPQGQVSAQFNYVDGGVASAATVTATLGAASLSSAITIVAPSGGLVINEVDYDQPSTDTAEYVEIYNPTSAPISLADLALILVSGGGTPAEYRRVLLGPAGAIPAEGYLVIASAAVTAAGRYAPPLAEWPETNALQNGPSDGMLLVNTATLAIIDRLSYEGSVTVTLPGFGSVNLVEGTPATAIDLGLGASSIARIPDGTDTNNAAADWAVTTILTPGAANVP